MDVQTRNSKPPSLNADPATLSHAARVLGAMAPNLPADAALRRYLVDSRRLGPREKRAISRAVFAYFRWLQWLDERASLPKAVEQAVTLQTRFNADEKSIKAETLAARAVPPWLHDEMTLPADYLRQLQREPALWLRSRPGMAKHVSRVLGDCAPTAHAPDALRYTGAQDLFLTPAFHQGEFEIQDLASQLVGYACAPRPGQTWWDACAGEGGKLLHLCDLMGNKGVVWATDRNERRLAVLKRRAARAQLFNYRTAPWDGGARLPTKTKFDGILIDAPCSGVGTWQRNPHARWSTTLDDVAELAVTQRALLDHVVGALKPGGLLVYSVCTLTRRETTAVASAFTEAHPELEPASVFPPAEGAAPSSGAPTSVTLWPHELNANGMFIAAWRRR